MLRAGAGRRRARGGLRTHTGAGPQRAPDYAYAYAYAYAYGSGTTAVAVISTNWPV